MLLLIGRGKWDWPSAIWSCELGSVDSSSKSCGFRQMMYYLLLSGQMYPLVQGDPIRFFNVAPLKFFKFFEIIALFHSVPKLPLWSKGNYILHKAVVVVPSSLCMLQSCNKKKVNWVRLGPPITVDIVCGEGSCVESWSSGENWLVWGAQIREPQRTHFPSSAPRS